MAGTLRFGRYETLFRIASGGMAEVFAARVRGELGFEKLVAVKRIVPHLAEDAAFVHMFLDEARLAAQVSSPHVVQTHELGRAGDGSLYIAMELVVGVTLSELIAVASDRGERLPVGVAVEIAAQAAEGLHDAHEARTPAGEPLEIVHRDVSPQNILVGVDGRVKVTDFGIARASQGRLAHTEHGQVKGKIAYFSPEQSRAAALDRRSDVFALGVVAWEMMAGARLFTGATPADVVVAIRRASIPDLHAVRPEVPVSIARVIEAALARKPSDRTESAAALARQLRAAAHEAELATGNAEVAAYLRDARVGRLGQLRDRIRAALESPEVRTLPDIEVAAPIAPPRERPDRDRYAPTAELAPEEPATRTAPDAVHQAHTVALPAKRSPVRWIAAATMALAVLGVVAYGASIEPPADRADLASTAPTPDLEIEPAEVEPTPAIAIDAGVAIEPPAEPEPQIVEVAEPEPTEEREVERDRQRSTPRAGRRGSRDRRRERSIGAVGAPAGLDAFERGVQR